MANGPLIPGLQEFDGPRRRLPRAVWWIVIGLVVAIGVVLLVGLFAGTGPARSLGLVTEQLQPVAYRPTTSEQVIQVAVGVPADGLCRSDDVQVRAFARSNRIEVAAERTRSRNSTCQSTGIAQDRVWIDVALDEPLGERQVIRESDRRPLLRETSGSLG
jgi:hypothetical protein